MVICITLSYLQSNYQSSTGSRPVPVPRVPSRGNVSNSRNNLLDEEAPDHKDQYDGREPQSNNYAPRQTPVPYQYQPTSRPNPAAQQYQPNNRSQQPAQQYRPASRPDTAPQQYQPASRPATAAYVRPYQSSRYQVSFSHS